MIKKTLTFNYWYGDKVTLSTDSEKKVRVISGITIRPSGQLYELACGENTTWHQAVEIEPLKVVEVKGFKK
jgi:hypothetical protein